ncbi:MAG: menaquinone reductase multiheme cytochrome c subunit QrcA [Desulfonatronovibrio sp.]
MEEKVAKKKKSCLLLPFVVGFVGALLFGWIIFPGLLFSEKEQPFWFSHPVHVEVVGMDCYDCHYYNEDGSFSGVPSTEECAACHMDVMFEDPDEIIFVEEYVWEEKEVPWLIYQKQPDNVYFSHMAHEMYDCTTCHPEVETAESFPEYHENRLTGYSADTMKMWECERCHAESGTSNACYVCHK